MIGKRVFFVVLVLFVVVAAAPLGAAADLASDLKAKINERNQAIAQLQQEIAAYQEQVDKTGAQAKTLKNAIAALELTQKKLSAEIKVIQNQIASSNLTISQLNFQISDTENKIKDTLTNISATIRQINQAESSSLVEALFNYPTLSTFLDQSQSFSELNSGLTDALANIRILRTNLQDEENNVEGKRKQLVQLSNNLSDKKKVADYNKAQTNKLLTDTKNQQANYQKILDQKTALMQAFEQEILDYESQLKISINPASLPPVGSAPLSWPLASIRITQLFGATDFARSHPLVYNGQGHNGVDFAASIGTPVMAARGGVVEGTGNTDEVCPGASYGRWVFIKHDDGLSTIYAHLSVIKVSAGQTVSAGDLIGYSGETGYVTGPHLHFGVYASEGVQITTRKSAVCRGTYTMPIATLKAYLNPLLYLPSLSSN